MNPRFVRTIGPVVFAAVPSTPRLLYSRTLLPRAIPVDTFAVLRAGTRSPAFFALYQDQRIPAEGLEGANQQLERANLSFATALVTTLDARDRYTAGHSAAVAIYSRDIAARLGLSETEQQRVHLAGLVHDIGKIGLPAGLLEKEGPLTLEERRVMQIIQRSASESSPRSTTTATLPRSFVTTTNASTGMVIRTV